MGKQWNSERLYFLGGSQITADGDCSHEIKRRLLLERKAMINLDSSFSFNIRSSNEYSGLISFRMDWVDLPAIHGTLKSLLQHHSSEASIIPLVLRPLHGPALIYDNYSCGNRLREMTGPA